MIAPSITSYFRYPDHRASVSIYNFTWTSLDYHSDSLNIHVTRYQIVIVETSSMAIVMSNFTQSSETTAVISLPSCESQTCRARVRAELSDGSFTSYSFCVRIEHQFILQTSKWE